MQKLSALGVNIFTGYSISHSPAHPWAEFLYPAPRSICLSVTHTEHLLSLSTHPQPLMEWLLSSLNNFCFTLWKAWIPQFFLIRFLTPYNAPPQPFCLQARQEMTQLWVADGSGNEEREPVGSRALDWVWEDGPCWDSGKQRGSQSVPPSNSGPLGFWLKYMLCFADIYQSDQCWFLNQSFLPLGIAERKEWGLSTLS